MVGYATAYTMLPVFSLVLDRDVNEDVALLYPELYKELTKVSKKLVGLKRAKETDVIFIDLFRDDHFLTRPSSRG